MRFVKRDGFSAGTGTFSRPPELARAIAALPPHRSRCAISAAGKKEAPGMPRRLKLVKGAAQKSALIYGMRIFAPGEVIAVEDARVRLASGDSGRVTMHFIEGTRAQIRKQLMQSIDAFFELLDDGETP
jgi:hypothetical protein